MKWISAILLLGVAVVLSSGCSSEPEEPVAPAKTEAELAAEQEAARQAEETSALKDRVGQLSAEIDRIGADGEMPASLEAALSQVRASQDGVEQLTAELEQSSGESWESARSRLEAALNDLRASKERVAAEAERWRERVSAARSAREEGGSPVDPETGLIQGLDGGEYEQYLPSAIERVQQRLRDMARYAGPVDGYLGKATMAAIGEFQKEQELQVSGVPSPMTRSRLFADQG